MFRAGFEKDVGFVDQEDGFPCAGEGEHGFEVAFGALGLKTDLCHRNDYERLFRRFGNRLCC